jgi:hypothetical protein
MASLLENASSSEVNKHQINVIIDCIEQSLRYF